jgi:hypothetical protein
MSGVPIVSGKRSDPESDARESKALRDRAIEELCPSRAKATKKWRIWRTSAKYVGQVEARDEKDALDKAIRLFNLAEPQKRLIAQPCG